jgi:uncharacterized membrane protein
VSHVRGISALRLFCAALFLVAGALHFVYPDSYERIVPEFLPNPAALVAISGVAEMLGGAGLLVPRFRRAAAYGLLGLLVAVFPANINTAIHNEALAPTIDTMLLWARLPLQLVLGWMVWIAGRDTTPEATTT